MSKEIIQKQIEFYEAERDRCHRNAMNSLDPKKKGYRDYNLWASRASQAAYLIAHIKSYAQDYSDEQVKELKLKRVDLYKI